MTLGPILYPLLGRRRAGALLGRVSGFSRVRRASRGLAAPKRLHRCDLHLQVNRESHTAHTLFFLRRRGLFLFARARARARERRIRNTSASGLESMGGGAVQKERDDELSQFADSIFTRYLSTGSTKFVHVSARVATDASARGVSLCRGRERARAQKRFSSFFFLLREISTRFSTGLARAQERTLHPSAHLQGLSRARSRRRALLAEREDARKRVSETLFRFVFSLCGVPERDF